MTDATRAVHHRLNAVTNLRPTLTRHDLVFSYRNFLRKIIRMCGKTIYQHKVKSLVVIIGLYAAHKTFGLYKSIRDMFNPMA